MCSCVLGIEKTDLNDCLCYMLICMSDALCIKNNELLDTMLIYSRNQRKRDN